MSRRLIRSLVIRAPFLQDAAVAAKRHALRLARRPFEPEFEILRRLEIGADECLVDIGANRGQSIDAMRLYCPAAPIIAFEPQAWLATMLASRHARDRAIQIRRTALGAEPATLTLFTPFYGEWRFDGLASLDREEASGWLGAKTLSGFERSRLVLKEESVLVGRLDDEKLTPAFMKIDVQGAEAAVLEGAAATLAKAKPVLLIETGTNEGLVGRIEALGYGAFNYLQGRLLPRTHAVRNAVFVHPERVRGLDLIGAGLARHLTSEGVETARNTRI